MNTNTEMNLNEMEMIASGSKTTDNMLRQGGKGAAIGAGLGGAAGSFFPVVGTAAGALIGTTVAPPMSGSGSPRVMQSMAWR